MLLSYLRSFSWSLWASGKKYLKEIRMHSPGCRGREPTGLPEAAARTVWAGRSAYFTRSSNCQGTKAALGLECSLLEELRFLFLEYDFCCDIAQSWAHEITYIRGDITQWGCLWNRPSPSSPGAMPNHQADIHLHFPYTVQTCTKGWEMTSCFFYKRTQGYKNLIHSFYAAHKAPNASIIWSPLHAYNWVISQSWAFQYY